MASKTKYIINDLTELEIKDALDYIMYSLKNAEAAKKLYEQIEQKIEQIVLFPNSGENYNNEFAITQGIKRVLVGNYYLYYIYNNEEKIVTFVCFAHIMRDVSVIV